MAKVKPVTTGTVGSAIDEAKSEMESLRDELQEWYDNMPENFQNGTKGDELTEAIDNLETAISDLEDVDLSMVTSAEESSIEWTYTHAKPSSRHKRLTNALDPLFKAQAKLEELVETAAEDDKDVIEDAAAKLSDAISDAENVMFPGMY